ncbi:MAG: tetraacyldisaccharide 4'-kinase, partial [Gammaproteobacteria bacterium]|nr:tetraacyldisaccharide 4'-kinase [Gammaproteobacteria bacterium]
QAMGLSNGHCLPVGPLREPHDRLTRVDFVVVNQANPVPAISSKNAVSQVNLDSIIKDLHTKGLTKGHTKIYNKIHFMERKSISCIKLKDHNLANLRASGCSIAEWQKSLRGKQVHAIAGIAQPQNFFNLLQEQGVVFTPHIFANHHKFSVAELNFGKDKVIIMTEKDAVKCSEFKELDNLWALRVNHELESSLISKIVAQL